MAPARVLVLYNEPVLPPGHPCAASERDVVDTADLVAEILLDAGFAVARLPVGRDPGVLLDGLRAERPDVVFNLFEGLADRGGEGTGEATAAGLLEWLGVPFTGSPASAIALARDKGRTKHLLRGAGLPTPAFVVAEGPPWPAWPGLWPAIVKPACQDASVGIDQASVVTAQPALERRLAQVLARFGPPALVEQFVRGREFHVHLVEDPAAAPAERLRLLPLAEIEFRRTDPGYWPVYTYDAKWSPDTREYQDTPLRSPVMLEAERMARLADIVCQTYRLVGCRDYARFDLRMTEAGEFFVLEVNPNPSFTSSAVVKGFQALGRSHTDFFVDLVRAALARG